MAVMNRTASSVAGELMASWPVSSCSLAPNDHRSPRNTMLESVSGASPNPAGIPSFSRILRAPSRTLSHVSGLIPTSPHQSVR